jgi:alcohol dehydrogenase
VGLSAIMIAHALGANVIAVDISEAKLALARSLGAVATVDASSTDSVVDRVLELTKGGAHVSVDALGHQDTCFNSISNLRKHGKHIQVGLMAGEHSAPKIPMGKVIGNELEIYGSHGMQAHRYDAMLAMLQSGRLAPEKLIGNTISLDQSIDALVNMDKFNQVGVTVITEF